MARRWPTHAALVLLGAGCAACGAPAPRPGAHCAERLPPLADATAAARAEETPRSLLTVDLSTSRAYLLQELSRRVPVALGGGRGVDAGVAGEVSWSARRGPLALELEGRQLRARTEVEVDVAVCKQIGPLCLTWGRCAALVGVVGAAPLSLDPRWRAGPVSLRAAVSRPCRLEPAGVDATPELEARARQALGAVEHEVNERLPELARSVSLLWRVTATPVAISARDCVAVLPRRALLARPELAEDRLSMRVGLEASVRVQRCGAPREEVDEAPPPTEVPSLPATSRLRVPVVTDWEEVSAGLTRSTSGAPVRAGTRVARIRAGSLAGAPHGRVAVRVLLEGEVCGELMLSAEPWFDAVSNRVRLRVAGPPSEGPRHALAVGVGTTLEERASVELPVDPGGLVQGAARLIEAGERLLPRGFTLHQRQEGPTVERVLATSDGLVAEITLTARLALVWGEPWRSP